MAKPQTLASYLVRVDRVMDYIYTHLDDDISSDDLADIACLSPYHWHRIWTAMRGETLWDTVKRLKLQRAAARLADSERPIPDIAKHAGYGSMDAFGRAFKEHFGQTPVDYRNGGSHAAFKAATLAEDRGGFPVTVEELPARRCAGIAHRGSYMQIDQAMGKLFVALTTQNLLAAAPAMLAVFFDDPDLVHVDSLRSAALTLVDAAISLNSPLEEIVLAGGLYARLRYKGPYADMKGAYRWLLGTWLPQSGFVPNDAPMFECYLNDPREVPATELLTDIHLPLVAP